MTDRKQIITEELEVLRKKEQQDGNTFKAIAYSKVIRQIKQLPKIVTMEDLQEVKGIGESIRKKIEEILETGTLAVAEEAKKDPTLFVMDQLMNIYGVGRVKAKDLVTNHGVTSIADLREKVVQTPDLLNGNQMIGLQYYEQFLERIPRKEMEKHEKILMKVLDDAEIVGSYRRGLPDSGDIDVLIKWPSHKSEEEGKDALSQIVGDLHKKGYITDTLALGDKKFMGVCKATKKGKARRLDLLLTPEKEYPFAVLYFTGSDKFNVEMRKVALEKGYSLNEHGFTPLEETKKKRLPVMKSEEDIFRFLGYSMIDPKERKDETTLSKYFLG